MVVGRIRMTSAQHRHGDGVRSFAQIGEVEALGVVGTCVEVHGGHCVAVDRDLGVSAEAVGGKPHADPTPLEVKRDRVVGSRGVDVLTVARAGTGAGIHA